MTKIIFSTFKPLVALLVLVTCMSAPAFVFQKPTGPCLSAQEKELLKLITAERRKLKLPDIPYSASLTKVAQLHAKDLETLRPDGTTCNMHSWSTSAKWTGCCYTADHAQASCMWNKPKEIAGFNTNGYEIAVGGPGASVDPSTALNVWKKSTGHWNVVTNKGIWSKYKWKAMGVGMFKGYAVVWFADMADPAAFDPNCPK
jgi:uncharacterized protein YkwD